MLESWAFWLTVLAALVGFLGASVAFRLHAEELRRRARENDVPGTAFDVSRIAPQIDRLRQDYTAALPSHRPHSAYRVGLIAAARQAVASLAYFRQARSAHETGPNVG